MTQENKHKTAFQTALDANLEKIQKKFAELTAKEIPENIAISIISDDIKEEIKNLPSKSTYNRLALEIANDQLILQRLRMDYEYQHYQ